MSKLEEIKLEISYLKYWLSVCIAADFGIVGVVFTQLKNLDTMQLMICFISGVTFSVGAFFISKAIRSRIRQTRNL